MSLQTRLESLANSVGADVKTIFATFAKTVTARDTVITSIDWNTITTPGTYQVAGGTWTNGPTGAYAYGQVYVASNGTITTQSYVTHGSLARTYIRSKYNTSDWNAWATIALTGDAPAAHTHSYVDLSASESVGGTKTFTGTARFNNCAYFDATGGNLRIKSDGTSQKDGGFWADAAGTLYLASWDGNRGLYINSAGDVNLLAGKAFGAGAIYDNGNRVYSAGNPPPAPAHTHAGTQLALTRYCPASPIAVASTSANYLVVDAANLTVTFTAPASGTVLVKLTATAGLGQCYWGLGVGGSLIAGTGQFITEATTKSRFTSAHRVTGLTPGNSYTYQWLQRRGSSGSTVTMYGNTNEANGGDQYGAAFMEVLAA